MSLYFLINPKSFKDILEHRALSNYTSSMRKTRWHSCTLLHQYSSVVLSKTSSMGSILVLLDQLSFPLIFRVAVLEWICIKQLMSRAYPYIHWYHAQEIATQSSEALSSHGDKSRIHLQRRAGLFSCRTLCPQVASLEN